MFFVTRVSGFNVFELQDALGKRYLAKTIRIIHYFEANPKNRIFAAPLLVFEGMVHIWKWNR